jgi:hypothetical protein
MAAQATLNERIFYVACIELPLTMNGCLRFLGGNELAMQNRTLAHVDYKTRH